MNVSEGTNIIISKSNELISNIDNLSNGIKTIKSIAGSIIQNASFTDNTFLMCITVLTLACFIGYFVVWNVTPALHSPLMAVTNAISSVIIIGAIIGLGATSLKCVSGVFSFIAIVLASINIFGGFAITYRMLEMFKKKSRK